MSKPSMRSVFAVLAVVVGLVSGLAPWIAASAPAPQAASQPTDPQQPAEDQGPRLDRFGDPLPAGAVGRLGTVRFRDLRASEIFIPPDGRHIITVAWRGYKVFDAATGATLREGMLPTKLKPSQDGTYRFGETTVFTPDGKHAIDFLPGGDLLLDVETGQIIRELKVDQRSVLQRNSHAFTPDGKYLAVAGKLVDYATAKATDPVLILYDLTTGQGKWLGRDERFGGLREHLAITPDGRWLLVSLGGLQCWDAIKDQERWKIKVKVDRMLMHPRGESVLTLRLPSELGLWSVENGEPAQERLPAIPSKITALAWAPDGRTLAASYDNQTLLWDLTAGQEIRRLSTGADHLAFSTDSRSLFTLRGVLQRWEVTTGKPQFPASEEWGHAEQVCHVHWSADGKTLWTASGDQLFSFATKDTLSRDYIFRWDVASCRPTVKYEGLVPYVHALGMGGQELIAVTTDLKVTRWDRDSGKQTRSIPLTNPSDHPYGVIERMNFSPGGRILTGGDQALLNLVRKMPNGWHRYDYSGWDLRTGKLLPGGDPGKDPPPDLGFSYYAWSLVWVRQKWMNPLLDRQLTPLQAPDRYSIHGRDLDLQDDHDLILLPTREVKPNRSWLDKDGGIGVWEAATGRLVKHIPFQWIFQRALTRGGRIAACFSYGKLYLFDVVAGKMLRSWDSQTYYGQLAFSPDGKLLATGLQDGTVLLWPVPEPRRSKVAPGQEALAKAWADLASEDAGTAWAAVWLLADHPGAAMPFLKDRVLPAPPIPRGKVSQWLADLDSASFPRREEATRRLIDLGTAYEQVVRDALKEPRSLEHQRRLQAVLDSLATIAPPRGEGLRGVRVVSVLERIGGPEAQRLLAVLAQGDDHRYPTREAKAALTRLRSQ